MARITVEDCLEHVPNRFELVLLAARRAKQLLKGARPLVESDNKEIVSALRDLADIEDRHAEWLRTRLLALGGQPPAAGPAAPGGNNQWERAVAALHAAQAKRRRLVEQIAHWDPEEPEMAALLRRIEQEDQGQQPVYEALIMRSDPQSID